MFVSVLTWLIDEENLELPDQIEEVNLKMLQRLLHNTEHVIVFFYRQGDKKSSRILQELENIGGHKQQTSENMNFSHNFVPLSCKAFNFFLLYAKLRFTLYAKEKILKFLISFEKNWKNYSKYLTYPRESQRSMQR